MHDRIDGVVRDAGSARVAADFRRVDDLLGLDEKDRALIRAWAATLPGERRRGRGLG